MMGEMISYSCPAGHEAKGYLAKAPEADAPAIVVLQEWWGLNDQIKGIADRFAAAGISALAPDLYQGRVTQDADEAGHMMGGLDWVGATEQEVQGAVSCLKAITNKVAVTGFCMGGALTIIACAKLSGVDAGVCFYGIPPAEQADPKTIKIPFQAHFANRDDWCTPASVDELDASLKKGGANYELYRYNAEHGFVNETRADVYNRQATQLAWERTIQFLNTHLS